MMIRQIQSARAQTDHFPQHHLRSRTTSWRASLETTTYSSEQMAIITMKPIISCKAKRYKGFVCVNLNLIKTDQIISQLQYYKDIINVEL